MASEASAKVISLPGSVPETPAEAWFTAADLAAMRLPGLPSNKRALNRRIADEGWAMRRGAAGQPLARPRAGRGGGMEFHEAVLPPAARVHLVRTGVIPQQQTGQPEHVRVGSWSWYDRQPDKVKAEARRRMAIVGEVLLLVDAGCTKSAAVAAIARDRGIGKATLWNWLGLIDGVARADREPALAPRYTGGGAEADLDPLVWQVLKSDFLRPECPTFTSCYDRARDVAEARGLAIPSERTLRRKLERELPTAFVTYKRKGEEALQRSVPAQRRTVDHLHALEIVNLDGHKFDVFVESPVDGKPTRPMMVAIQDVYSSKVLAWCLDVSENAICTQVAFGKLFREYGIPKAVLTDNSRAFASKTITGGATSRFRFKVKADEPTGVLTALDINVKWAKPYHGQSKPIERAFRDMADRIARHPEVAGAYTGNSTENKPANYGKRVIAWDVFAAHVDSQIARHNAETGRRGRHYAGRSFDQVFAESYAVAPIGKATVEQLRLALLTAERKRVNRQTAEIELFGNRYWAPELDDYRGEKMMLRFDPENLHSAIFVYDDKGRFVVAADVMLDTGFDTHAGAVASERRQKMMRKAVRQRDEMEALLAAHEVAAMLPKAPAAPQLPDPAIIQMRRHRGQLAAALELEPQPDPRAEARKVAENRVFSALRLVERED